MRKLLALTLAAALALMFSACLGAFHEKKDTSHYVDTDQYTLSVKGHRLANDKHFAEAPIQFDGDTVRLYGDVTIVAAQLVHRFLQHKRNNPLEGRLCAQPRTNQQARQQ